jgi:translation initiation factor 2B subunit (eIF-2B alpha/beta/delta family)
MPSTRHSFSAANLASTDAMHALEAPSSASELSERLRATAGDRAATGKEVVCATSAIVASWLCARGEAWSFERAGEELESGLGGWIDAQGWRGTCAVWLDSLRRVWHEGRAAEKSGERAIASLVRELDAWLADDAQRLPSRASVARHALEGVERGELILVDAFSDTVAHALEALARAGRRPQVLVAELQPDLDGRRMARRLVQSDIPVSLCYDAALCSNVPRADRVWLSTEAIGSDALLARAGTRQLVEEAERCEVPVFVLATSDKLVPGGELRLPNAHALARQGADALPRPPVAAHSLPRADALAWKDAPEGVRVEGQVYEAVPLDMLPRFITEIGNETATALHLRALRIEAAPPCLPAAPHRETLST